MIMPELMEIYRCARPNGTHTKDEIKRWGEHILGIDSFSPRRLQELVDDPDDGIDVFLAKACRSCVDRDRPCSFCLNGCRAWKEKS